MLKTISETSNDLLNNMPVGYVAAIAIQVKVHWMQWGSPLIDGLATVAGFVLICTLIFRNILTITKEWNKEQ